MSSDECRRSLEEAKRTLEAAGFPVMVEDGTLTSFFAMDKEGAAFAYTVECSEDGRPEAYAGMRGLVERLKGLDCSARERFWLKLLELPSRYRVSVGLDKDLLLIYFPPGDPATVYTYVGSTYALGASMAGWIMDALEALEKGGEIPEFRPEEAEG
ncbi:MAG: hypothetical protein GSR73_02220 [Desulfurococcales archaeon]|nr:hypothetical protein [Desulfurococcales archaeon]